MKKSKTDILGALRAVSSTLLVAAIIGTVSFFWGIIGHDIDARAERIVKSHITEFKKYNHENIIRIEQKVDKVDGKVDKVLFLLVPGK